MIISFGTALFICNDYIKNYIKGNKKEKYF